MKNQVVDETEIVDQKVIVKLEKYIPISSVREVRYDASANFSSPLMVEGKEAEDLVELQQLVKEQMERTKKEK